MAAPACPDENLMLALTYQGKEAIELSRVPVPVLSDAEDTAVIVRVSLCGICGSDLHPYHCREEGLLPGTVTGHEFTGTIVSAGSGVRSLSPGDRVMSAFTTSCGSCFYCQRGLTCRCEHSQGAACFGWVSAGGGGLQGAHAQFIKVPLADGTLLKVPEGVSDEQCILLGDILSTAFFCADQGGIGSGDVVAVLGCGPVGLLAVLAARARGAAAVLAVDGVASRCERAASLGATAFDLDTAPAAVRTLTEGRGADVVLELVGSAAALRLGFELLRPGGVLSSIGVHTDSAFPFSPTDGYNKNLTYRSGRCPARRYMQELLPLVQGGELPFTDIITHRLPLSQGVEAYRMFAAREKGVVKIVLDPWADDDAGRQMAAASMYNDV